MGETEGWLHQPPNGLLPNEGSLVMRILDSERWAKAEEQTAELIACIQPNALSEERRSAVAVYVQKLIMKCFPCHVFTFGSVPLKTYLPDGDIDLTAFSNDQNLKDTWAHQVRDALENEEKNENAEFRVKEIQYIQAEVKIIKCLVENIVVDISFNQLGGLCTLCFLEEVDNLIEQNHLFKRSIILIKAWCYYESRILGAHHGLISTYALETLVLYIFNVFNNNFAGPLEVLYRFLEFFSKFDWNNFCVSLWGPVPISSLPDATAEAPRKDGGDLLLNKLFLDACSVAYSVSRPQENQGHPFVSKHLNIIDPLRTNNNLGRSVSKGNFFRIRSALAFGAKCLARVLECPKEDAYNELNKFFMNTWDRHGSCNRPDAPRSDMSCGRLSSSSISEDLENKVDRKNDESILGCESQVDGVRRLRCTSSQQVNVSVGSYRRNGNVTAARDQDQKRSESHETSETSDSVRPVSSSSHGVPTEIVHKNFKHNHLVNDQGRHLFARTHSSPELTDNCGKFSSQERFEVPESKKSLAASARLDNRRGKNLESDNCASHSNRLSNNMPSSVRSVSSNQSGNISGDTNSATNSYCNGSGPVTMNMKDDIASGLGTQGMYHGEQNRASMMASSATHGHNGRANVPLNLATDPLLLRTSPPFPASMGFPQRNLGGIVRTDIPFIENLWGANMQFPNGQVSMPPTHYFHKVDLTCSKETVDSNSENLEIMDTNPGDEEHYWCLERGRPNGRYDQNHRSDFGHSSIQAEGTGPQSVPPLCGPRLQITEKKLAETSGSGSVIPAAPVLLGSRQRVADNSGALPFAFYPTGPPVPFVMVPLHNFPSEMGNAEASNSHFNSEEGIVECVSGQNLDSLEVSVQADISGSMSMAASAEPEEHRSDILNGDFASHWQNLQFGRFCQNSPIPAPLLYPSSMMAPPVYLQSHYPWDGSLRPMSTNAGHVNQFMTYGPRLIPTTPFQPLPNRPAGFYPHYIDEVPKHRSGTGTYFPNPASLRERHSTSNRRGVNRSQNSSYDRNDHADRERNWNTGSKSRTASHSQNPRQEQINPSESRAGAPWDINRHESFSSFNSRNGPIRDFEGSSTNMPYGVYPLTALNPSGMSSNGPNVPPLVMLYPYDHNSPYTPTSEQLEFGSLGPVGFSGSGNTSPLSEGTVSGGAFEEQRVNGGSAKQTSPDQPSSPHFQR